MTLITSNTTRALAAPSEVVFLRNPTKSNQLPLSYGRAAPAGVKAGVGCGSSPHPLVRIYCHDLRNQSSLPLAAPGLVISNPPNRCAQPPSPIWTVQFRARQLSSTRADLPAEPCVRRQIAPLTNGARQCDQLGFEGGSKSSRLRRATAAGPNARPRSAPET